MSDHPLADGTDAGALAVILDECKGGPWKPDDGTSLWFYNAAGDQIHLTGDDVALLLHAALARAAPRAEGPSFRRLLYEAIKEQDPSIWDLKAFTNGVADEFDRLTGQRSEVLR